MIRKLSRSEVLTLTSESLPSGCRNYQDEMAIPSYLHKNPLVRWLMWKRYECIAELAKFSSDMSVLEFGCGIGGFLAELNRSCGKVFATDIYLEYAKSLCKKGDLNVAFVDSMSEIANNSLSVIIAADVLEHIIRVDEYLSIFFVKLKANGRLIISGPTENAWYKIGKIVSGFGNKGGYHHSNIEELIDRIERSGFSLIQCRKLPFTFSPCLFKVAEFEKLQAGLKKLATSGRQKVS